jgi:competence protein ComEC
LKAYGIDTLDAVVLSHDDNDHLGGLISVVQQFPVRRIFLSNPPGNSPEFLSFQNMVQGRGVPSQTVWAGQMLPGFEDVSVWVLHPDSGNSQGFEGNNASVVLQVRIGQTSFLFPGDVQVPAESELLRYKELLNSQVLLVCHHGSANSNSLAFLQAVKPEIAVISAGKRNPYGHPAAQVLERLSSLSCDIERTDLEGAIVLRTDGKNIWKYDGWK